MKMALRKLEFSNGKISKMESGDDYLVLVDADSVQFSTIKSWGLMKWDKGKQALYGPITIELLDKLASIVRLPPAPEQRRSGSGGRPSIPCRMRWIGRESTITLYPLQITR